MEIILGEPYGVADVVAAVRKMHPVPHDIQWFMDRQLPAVHVVLVDDSPDIREVLTQTLELQGATVTAVSTAEEALNLVEQMRPDVRLSDLEMPHQDGFWLIGRVRALAPDRGGLTPAACLTGRGDPEDRARVRRAGFSTTS